jgi:hypothetical protein
MSSIIFTPDQLKQLKKMVKPVVTPKTEDTRLMKVGVSKKGKGYMVANRTAVFERQVRTFLHLLEQKVTIKDLKDVIDSIERINMGLVETSI